MSPTDRLLILDFGSQYTMLIARRIRELHVYCEIWPPTRSMSEIQAFAPSGVILSGGPSSVYDDGAPLPDAGLFALGVPVLGICYGMQAMARVLGGHVAPGATREYGPARIQVVQPAGLLAPLLASSGQSVWMSHGDHVDSLPDSFDILATSGDLIAAIGSEGRHLYGVQFHPEVHHTPEGARMLGEFVFGTCRARPSWTMASFAETAIARIRERVGPHGRVVCGLSGGVDSTVAAVLMHRALGDRLTCVFVDNGLLRKGEAEEVVSRFRDGMHLPVVAVDAAARFLGALDGIDDPEIKRKRIGGAFVEVFEHACADLERSGARPAWLGQGTLYPDVIESVSFRGPSATIKTHHNVGGLPERMRMGLVEPLRELFKDEVRALGRELGIAENFLMRQPFPGPGLAVRILGEVTAARLAVLREADAIVRDEIDRWDTDHRVWQYFAVLLPVRSVGVMGDQRTYDHVVAVRAVASVDGMTADWADLPRDLLGRISSRIINEVRGVNRVTYDISSKPPATIEWE